NCGDIALHCGMCGGAEIILVPEMAVDLKEICRKLLDAKVRGKHSEIIVLAEGAGNVDEIAAVIEKKTGIPVRTTVLGYIQRGGNPSMMDRLLGTNMGAYAVKLLNQDIGNRIIGVKDNRFYDIDIVEGLALKKVFDKELYETAAIVAR
ncbi:MAG: 6-phosphofructokinase, partial [Firmicutes bacterium]|nr:6-phosphofructokinase [Bacillota bacterium]